MCQSLLSAHGGRGRTQSYVFLHVFRQLLQTPRNALGWANPEDRRLTLFPRVLSVVLEFVVENLLEAEVLFSSLDDFTPSLNHHGPVWPVLFNNKRDLRVFAEV